MPNEEIYLIPPDPTYNPNIRKLQNSDPANADLTFNPLVQQMVENAHALYLLSDDHIADTALHVTPATMENYNIAISGLIAHTEDGALHTTEEEKAKWTMGTEEAAQAVGNVLAVTNKVAELEGRIGRVEDGLFHNLTGNPFLVSFSTLDGLVLVKGNWNKAKHCIEC